jgi:hypothetical protein
MNGQKQVQKRGRREGSQVRRSSFRRLGYRRIEFFRPMRNGLQTSAACHRTPGPGRPTSKGPGPNSLSLRPAPAHVWIMELFQRGNEAEGEKAVRRQGTPSAICVHRRCAGEPCASSTGRVTAHSNALTVAAAARMVLWSAAAEPIFVPW